VGNPKMDITTDARSVSRKPEGGSTEYQNNSQQVINVAQSARSCCQRQMNIFMERLVAGMDYGMIAKRVLMKRAASGSATIRKR
jgi:hypothetical protein